MKRPRPGFKAYFKKRIRDPFRFTEDMIIEGGGGRRFRDVGSAHTIIIKSVISLSVLMVLGVFNWTAAGTRDVIFIGIFMLFLHRFFRYFWTDFELVDEEGNPTDDKSLLYVRKRRERSKAYNKLIKLIGEDETPSEYIYYRYRWWQRIIIFLEAVLLLGILIAIPALSSGSPYSRLYTVELRNPDMPNIEWYSYDGSPVVVPEPYDGKIPLKKADTLLEAYGEARSYIDTFCREAGLTNYGAELEDGQTIYHFTFKNFRRGLLYKKDYAIMDARVNADEDWMKVYYWSYYAIGSQYGPIEAPKEEINVEKILDIICKETGEAKSSLKYYYIGAHSLINDSPNNYDPGGDTWWVAIHFTDRNYYFTVDLTKGTAIREERYYEVS